MLECRRACAVAIRVEQQQALGQIAVVHVFQQEAYCLLTFLAGKLLAEGELRSIIQKLADERSLYPIVEVLKQILEHTRSRTRCRNELQHLVSLCQILLPGSNIFLTFGNRRADNALVQGCRLYYIQHGEARLETLQLLFRFLYGDSASTQLLEVLLGKVHGSDIFNGFIFS